MICSFRGIAVGNEWPMGIGISIFLMAVGAVLYFATNIDISGIDLSTVGVILMIVGAIGLVAALFIFGPRKRTTTIVEDDDGRGRTV